MKRIICFVFCFLIFVSINLKLSFSNEINKNITIFEIDKCTQLDLIPQTKLIIISATCSPEKNNYFFRLWSSKENVFAFSRLENKNKDQKLYAAEFKLKEIFNLKQIILRKKTQNGKFPKFLIYDETLFKKVLHYIKKKAPFDILLASKKQYNLLTFRSDFHSKIKIDHEVESLKTIEQINSRKVQITKILEKLNFTKINDNNWKCELSDQHPNKYDFLYVWTDLKLNPDDKNCWYEIIFNQKKLNHTSQIEKITWEFIRQINSGAKDFDININSSIQSLSVSERESLKHFISYDLLKFALNKNHATEIVFKILNLYFPNDYPELYSASLSMNCSSFSKKRISAGQGQIDKYKKKLTPQELAISRFKYYLNREDIFPNFKYASGIHGLIGKYGSYDYCVNLATTISYFLKFDTLVINNEEDLDLRLKYVNSFLELIEINKIFIEKNLEKKQSKKLLIDFENKLTDFKNNRQIYKSLQIWYFQLASLENFNLKNYKASVKNWKNYLSLKYNNPSSNWSNSDIEYTLNLLFNFKKYKDKKDIIFLKKDIIKLINLFVFKNDNDLFDYYDDFNFIENNIEIIDKILIILEDIYGFKNIDNLIFKLHQKKHLTPEKLALTRFFTLPRSYLSKDGIDKLLIERKKFIENFYMQLKSFQSTNITEREKLNYFKKLEQKSRKDFFYNKKDVVQELFERGTVTAPASQKKDIIELSKLLLITDYLNKLNILKKHKSSSYGMDEISFQKFDSSLAVNSYINLKKIDKNIYLKNENLYKFLSNKSLNLKETMKYLNDNEAIIFVSQNFLDESITTFVISNKIFKKSKIKIDNVMRNCLRSFNNKILNLVYENETCNKFYKNVFFANESSLEKSTTNVKYLIHGDMKKIPPTIVYQNDFTSKSNINEEENSTNLRGLKITKSKKNDSNNKNYLWYWEKYNFNLLPSINLLNVQKYLSTLQSLESSKFLGIAIADIPPEFQKKNFLRKQNLLKKIPQAKEEIINNSKIWGKKSSQIFVNQEATINNLSSYFLNNYPKILSIATHTVKRIDQKFNRSPSLLIYPNEKDDIETALLTPKIIDQYDIAGQFVILSACKTLETNNFFENTTLVSSFLLNGAQGILLTYWEIDDNSTKLFMNKFFEEITLKDKKYDDAIRSSIKNLIKKGYSHPFYWGPFALLGNS